jgi:hypothetical protein
MFRRTVKNPNGYVVKAFCIPVTTSRQRQRSGRSFLVRNEGLAAGWPETPQVTAGRVDAGGGQPSRRAEDGSHEAGRKPDARPLKRFSAPAKPVSSQGIAR